MSSWRPYSSPIRFVFAILPLLAIVVAGWLWLQLGARATAEGYDFRVFLAGLAFALALLLAGVSSYLAWCAFTMEYRLDRNSLRIRCGGVTHVIPFESIEAVYEPGENVLGRGPVAVQWAGGTLSLPGYVVGTGKSSQVGRVVSIATVPVERQAFVVTPGLTFGVSPENPTEFVRQVETKLRVYKPSPEDEELGIRHGTHARTVMRGWSSWGAPLWNDRVARALFLSGLGLCVLLFGYISLVYQGLPPNLPLHWDAQAQPDQIGDPSEVLRLPMFALLVWLVNAVIGWAVLARERAATLFLLGGAATAQLVFAVGALSIVLRALK